MAQHLEDIKKSVSEMTTEELVHHVAEIRRQKYVARPAAKKHKAKAEKVERKTVSDKVKKLAAGLSQEEIAKILGG